MQNLARPVLLQDQPRVHRAEVTRNFGTVRAILARPVLTSRALDSLSFCTLHDPCHFSTDRATLLKPQNSFKTPSIPLLMSLMASYAKLSACLLFLGYKKDLNLVVRSSWIIAKLLSKLIQVLLHFLLHSCSLNFCTFTFLFLFSALYFQLFTFLSFTFSSLFLALYNFRSLLLSLHYRYLYFMSFIFMLFSSSPSSTMIMCE